MKKEVFKTLVITFIYCCEGLLNGNKSLLALILTFACIFFRSFIFGESNGNKNEIASELTNSIVEK